MFTISTEKENNCCIVKLNGRIDSTNAADAEAMINGAIDGFSGELVLDAQELSYISSAGLRVILRLKRRTPQQESSTPAPRSMRSLI